MITREQCNTLFQRYTKALKTPNTPKSKAVFEEFNKTMMGYSVQETARENKRLGPKLASSTLHNATKIN